MNLIWHGVVVKDSVRSSLMSKILIRLLQGINQAIHPQGLEDNGVRAQLLRWVTWYWFFAASILLLVGMHYLVATGMPDSISAIFFTLLLSVGHWFSLTFLLAMLVFYPLILVMPLRRHIVIASIILCTIVIALVVADSFVFSLFRIHLNGMVFSLLFSDAGGEIFVFDQSMYLTAIGIVLLITGFAVVLAHFSWRMTCRNGNRWLGPSLGLLVATIFLAENFWFAWADAASDVEITSQARLYPLYNPTRAEDFFVQNGLVDTSQKIKNVKIVSGNRNYPQQPLTCNQGEERPDIYIIAVDSWRYDELNERVTPNLYAFSRQAMLFTHHYSGGNNTRTGLFSLFYALPATYWEGFFDGRVGSVFIRQLLNQQYDMAIYASAKLTSPEFDRTIFSEVPNLRTRTQADSVYGRDVRSTDEFVNHLNKADANKPMFGFLFYDAPHSYAYDKEFTHSFEPVAESMNYFKLGKETDPTPYRNLYRRSVKSVDKLVGRALATIRAKGRWDNAVIVITSDHGQEFNDNKLGYWGHNGNFTDAQIRVPLLIKWPGKKNLVYTHTTTHYDVVTTLLQELFGCSNSPSDYGLGASLFSQENRYGFVVGGFGDFAIRLHDRIYWIDKFGGVNVLNARNRRVNEKPEPSLMAKAMAQISRFKK